MLPRPTDVAAHALVGPVTGSDCADLLSYIKSKRNKNTIKKTDKCVKNIRDWLASPTRCESRPLEVISPAQLEQYIEGWLLELKKPDGQEYEPDSLTSMHWAIKWV